jgi:hypothetical protein
VFSCRGDFQLVEKVGQEIDGGHGGVELSGKNKGGGASPAADVGNLQTLHVAQARQRDA